MKKNEEPPFMCKVCGEFEILEYCETCDVCGWEEDTMQQRYPDYPHGANRLSLNQYKKMWKENREKLIKLDFAAKCDLTRELAKSYGYVEEEETEGQREARINSAFEEEFTPYELEKMEKLTKLVRNDFKMVGKYNMPFIRKQDIDIDTIDLWGYTKIKENDEENYYRTIHFFTHDWHFDNVYEDAEEAIKKLKPYYALLTPDFSMYTDMPLALQIYSTFKNRWCGAFWQSRRMKVIPNILWGEDESFEFSFDGVEVGSVVAISTYGTKNKERFMRGYNRMLEVIKPSAIICYGEKFKEMKGRIKEVLPYDKEELISKIGRDEYTKKLLEGTIYPSR